MKERVKVLNEILEARGTDLRAEYQRVWRNNVEREAYVLRGKNNAAPVLYRSSWYDKPDEDVADFLCKAYSEYSLMVDVQGFTDPESVKEHILPRISSEENREMLLRADIAFIENVEGLLTSFYLPVDLNPEKVGCLQITNTLLNVLSMTTDEAYAAALKNVYAVTDVISMAEALAEVADVDLNDESICAPRMTVVTNKDRWLGAAAILCPELYDLLQERLGTDKLIVLPSSIHEVIVVTADDDADLAGFKSMVREVNDTQVSAEDRLSYNVYGWRGGKLQAIA